MNSISMAADDLATFHPSDWPTWVVFFLLELRRNHVGKFDNVWVETIEKIESLGWEYWRQLWEEQLPEVWKAKGEM